MIKKSGELKKQVVEGLKDGKGQIEMCHLLDVGNNEFSGKGRLFAKNVLKPGCSIGFHKHEGDSETYFILSGQGVVNDNGTETIVEAGDVVYTPDGESHSLKNKGDEDLVFIALILYA